VESKKLPILVDLVNTYYAFVVLIYAVTLYVASHSHLFTPIFIVATMALASWGGYLLKSLLERRNVRYGFQVVSDVMTYEIHKNHRYTLKFNMRLKAQTDHLFAYPVGHQWTGSGGEKPPTVTGDGQQLLAVVEPSNDIHHPNSIVPYKLSGSSEGNWQYWFVAFNPAVHKGQTVDLKYTQEFEDRKNLAQPCLYYYIRTRMERLELNVHFANEHTTKKVSASYIKPSDPRRAYTGKGMVYDPDKQWATWVIEHPKKGYRYQITWQ
jgi:hypothetical protein